MKPIILAACFISLLSGCSPTPAQTLDRYLMPPELEGCKVIQINNGITYLYVIKCDDKLYGAAETGKNPTRTIVIDGIEYIKKKK